MTGRSGPHRPLLRPPYSVLARHYDEAYAPWRAFLSIARDEILRQFRVRFDSALDCGAATGWQSLELARRGTRVVAVEPVASFLPALRHAARAEALAVETRRGALPYLPLRPEERFDLALATFDVLNHLRSKALLGAALASLSGAIGTRKHLLFDLVTPEALAEFPEHHRVTRLSTGAVSLETGDLDPRTGAGVLTRDWFLPAGEDAGTREPSLYRRVRETYREVAWEREEIEEAIHASGLVPRLFEDASGWMSLSPEGARWIILVRRRD